MRGLLGFTLGLVLVWMIAGMVSEPATAAPTPAAVANYANDGSHSPSTTTGNTPERGPPPYTSSAVTVHDAVDRWSNGASASPDRAIRFGITYDAPAGLGDVARRTHATEGDGQRSDESSCAFERSGVAANTPARFAVNSAGEATLSLRAGSSTLEVTEHAALRMAERGVSIEAAERTLAQQPFRYFHDDVWKTGYYDPTSRLFLGSIDGRVTTVINRASQNYINNLKAAAP